MRRYFVIPVLVAAFGFTATLAQRPGAVRPGTRGANGQRANVDRELWRVLEDWSRKSAAIERLEGEILRRTYDTAFGVERIGEGYFYFEAPDKGRLDLDAYPITPKMRADRQKKGAKVRRKEGVPYKLESDQREKWVCDGKRIISVEVEDKTATVGKLPEELRGRNIMNGPLPFLFGLPPADAVARFEIEMTRRPTQKNPFAWLKAKPKRSDDQREWREADVILDTRTGLPSHVRLIKPSETLEEVYRFSKLKVNSRAGKVLGFFGRQPFKVDLHDYQVNVAMPDNGQPIPGAGPQGAAPGLAVVPNVIGLSHQKAEAALNRVGIGSKNISKLRGKAARTASQVFRVQQQNPVPGTPIEPGTRVSLRFWTEVQ